MPAYTTVIALQCGPGATGLTFSAQLYDRYATPVGSPVVTGFTELGGGNYAWIGEIPDDSFLGTVEFRASNGRKYVQAVKPSGGTAEGTGIVLVDHNYGGTDNYAYKTVAGAGVGGAFVMALLEDDYLAGHTSQDFAVASTVTGAGGRWAGRMALNPGRYTLVYFKPGAFGPDNVLLVVL